MCHFIHAQSIRLVAPSDLVISCKFDYDDVDLTDPQSTRFGRMLLDSSKCLNIVTYDIACPEFCDADPNTAYPGKGSGVAELACNHYENFYDSISPNKKYDLQWGKEGYVVSKNSVTINIQVSNNFINGVGLLTRKFIVVAANGEYAETVQKIWVVDGGRFYINVNNLCDTTDDIYFEDCYFTPLISNCTNISRSPEIKILNTKSTLLAIDFNDEIVRSVKSDSCIKLFREWKIIDWYQFNGGKAGIWSYKQVIIINDLEVPTIKTSPSLCTESELKGDGEITLQFFASDNCSPSDHLYYSYYVDLDDDKKGKYNNEFDLYVSELTVKESNSGLLPRVKDNMYANSKNLPYQANGKYPKGKHRMKVICQDGCKNMAEKIIHFEVVEAQAPNVTCKKNIILASIGTNGLAQVDVKDLVSDYSDNCSSKQELSLAFEDGTSSISFNCGDIIKHGGSYNFLKDVYVTDLAGNSSSCKVELNISDPNSYCRNGKIFEGKFLTLDNRPLDKVNLKGSSLGLAVQHLNECDSSYSFEDFSTQQAYFIPYKKDSIINNGIDVLDAVLLDDFILGVPRQGKSIYPYLGDVNNTRTITAADVSEISRAIIRYYKFSGQDEWVFIDSLSNLRDTILLKQAYQTVRAYKKGDIDANAKSQCNDTIEPVLNKLYLNVEDKLIYSGLTTINFYSPNFKNIDGLQATLHCRNPNVTIENISSELFNAIGNANFSWAGAFPFLLRRSEVAGISSSSKMPIFSVTVNSRSIKAISAKDLFYLSDSITKNIAYANASIPLKLELNNLLIAVEGSDKGELVVYPNPSESNFVVVNTTDMNMPIEIFDLHGRLIANQVLSANSKSVLSEQLFKESGVFLLRSRVKGQTSIMKLVKL